jgi:phosphate/sulfate permease
MRRRKGIACALLGFALAVSAWSQTTDQSTTRTEIKQKNVRKQKNQPSPGRQVANGTGNIAAGAGKGAGDAAKGVGKSAANLATLHPSDAAGSLGKGAAATGKDVTVGTAKGGGKIVKGLGRGIKHLF